ncbi:uncharacterized protein DS421_16g556110 [Arachis hypogaea]|nr:uncharacterized protein DS421_16g556110 [Arachis hypogaea]
MAEAANMMGKEGRGKGFRGREESRAGRGMIVNCSMVIVFFISTFFYVNPQTL